MDILRNANLVNEGVWIDDPHFKFQKLNAPLHIERIMQ